MLLGSRFETSGLHAYPVLLRNSTANQPHLSTVWSRLIPHQLRPTSDPPPVDHEPSGCRLVCYTALKVVILEATHSPETISFSIHQTPSAYIIPLDNNAFFTTSITLLINPQRLSFLTALFCYLSTGRATCVRAPFTSHQMSLISRRTSDLTE